MANTVYNTTTVTAPTKKAFAEFKKACFKKGEKLKGMKKRPLEFTFHGIVGPLPEELKDINYGGQYIDGVYVTRWRDVDGKSIPVDEEALKAKYGSACAYDWQVEHFGVKWDAETTNVKFDKDGKSVVIQYNTPWGSPEKVIYEMAQKWPKFHIEHEYEEEGGWGGSMQYEGDEEEGVSASEYSEPDLDYKSVNLGMIAGHPLEVEFEYFKYNSGGSDPDVKEGFFYEGTCLNDAQEIGETIEEVYQYIATNYNLELDYVIAKCALEVLEKD